ncbi:MAG: hypothetical protein DDT24_00710 [Chloroflexi bacterium]|nr:hypothetical protein [Chloroflexota bacterium]
MVIKCPCQPLCQGKTGDPNAQTKRQHKAPRELVEGFTQSKGDQTTKKVQIRRIDGVNKFLVKTQDKCYCATGYAGNNIGRTDKEAACRQPQVILQCAG